MQIDIFLSQTINKHKQSSDHALKKLHDISTQCVNSIRKLCNDIATWDPILVHLLTKNRSRDTGCDKNTVIRGGHQQFIQVIASIYTGLR